MGYKPVQIEDRTTKIEVLEDGDQDSVEDLIKAGFKEYTATVMTDDGVFYILVSDRGTKKWFPLRYD